MKKIKVLYIINSLGLGGAERLLVTTIKYLSKERYKPIVCSLTNVLYLKNEVERLGVKVYSLNFKGKIYNLPSVIECIWRIRRIIIDENVDIIHTHLYESSIIGRVASLSLGKKIITTLHSFDPWVEGRTLKHKIKNYFDLLTSRLTNTRFIGVARQVKDYYIRNLKMDEKDIIVIHNFIDLSEFCDIIEEERLNRIRRDLHIHNKGFILVCIARFYPEKGHKYLIRAMKEINLEDIRLLLISDGPLKEECIELVKRYGLQDKVIFLGYRKDIKELLSISDLLILPSLWEGLSITLVEAMSLKKPVIATNVGGIPEVVKDGITGILVEPQNPDQLRDAIITLYKDRRRCIEMGENGRRWVSEKFDARIQVKRFEEFYMETMKK